MAANADTAASTGDTHQGHVAVVYVHGMGDQRRHEEVSRLVDAIDIFLSNAYRKRRQAKGFLTKVRPRLQPSRNDPKRTETYIRAIHRQSEDDDWANATYARFYEVYWAPVMAEHSSARQVVLWLFSQVRRPLQTMRAQWRERQRLRRSVLAELFEHSDRWPAGVQAGDFAHLAKRYHGFENPQTGREFPEGSFDDFLGYLKQALAERPQRLERLLRLCRLWRTRYWRREVINGFLLVTLGVAMLLMAAVAAGLILFVLQRITAWQALQPLLAVLPEAVAARLDPTWGTAFGLAVSLGGLIGIGRFLTAYLGDVESWCTYEETDTKHERRKKVIERGFDLLSHVLGDPGCRRAVIVAHSLGTAVAHDVLLEAARYNRAHNGADPIKGPVPLDKISHFVTFGSPIDKIQYFFESYKSRYHRYKRVVEELRGDIGDTPFSRNGKPFIHWINYWDEGDIISGALHSPASRLGFQNRVDNIHLRNLHFPDPGGSHAAYFENRRVIGDLFDIIYKGAYGFEAARLVPGAGYDYDSAYLEAGDATGSARVFAVPAVAVPWLLLLGLLLRFANFNTAAMLAWSIAGLALAFVIAGFLVGKVRGHRLPL